MNHALTQTGRFRFLALVGLLAVFIPLSATTRVSTHYRLITESLNPGGTSYSANYAHYSGFEPVAGVSAATIPDATTRFVWHGFIPQLDLPLFAVADLAVSLTVSPTLSFPQALITLSGTVTNSGSETARNVVLTITLPLNVTFDEARLSQGSSTLSGTLLRCELGTIPGDAAATFAIDLTPTVNGDALVIATASAEAVDTSPANNSASAQSTVVTAVRFTGAVNGMWLNPGNWSPPFVPTETNLVLVTSGVIDYWDVDSTVAGLTLSGGRINASRGPRSLTVTKAAVWTGGELQGLKLVIPPGGFLHVTNGSSVSLRAEAGIENYGTVRLESTALQSVQGAWVTNQGIFEIVGNPSLLRFEEAGFLFYNLPGAVFRKAAGAGVSRIPVSFRNQGSVEVLAGALDFSGAFINGGFALVNSGTLWAGKDSEIRYTKANSFQHGTFFDGPGTNRVIAASMAPGDGSEFLGTIRGRLEIANGRMSGTFTNLGDLHWSGGNFQSALGLMTVAPGATLTLSGGGDRTVVNSYGIRNLGVMRLAGAGLEAFGGGLLENHGLLDIAGDFSIRNGVTLSNDALGILEKSAGIGVSGITANFTPNNGVLDLKTGTLALAGNYTPTAFSTLRVHIGGLSSGSQFSRLTVAGSAMLNGGLDVVPSQGFVPAASDTFQILSAASRSGTFARVTAGSPAGGVTYVLQYEAGGVRVMVEPAPPVLTAISLRSINGQIAFTYQVGTIGKNIIETSPDLAVWEPLRTNAAAGNPITFVETNALQFQKRFFRAVLVP